MEMISRFRGEAGRPRLIWALRKQPILHDNETLSNELADQAELLQFEAGEKLIIQDDADNDIYFILAGRTSIVVNGREVAIRNSGQHVGEMVLIDLSARRAASVIAIEQTVVVKISETSFRSLAEKYQRIWQLITVELADRLRQRNRLVAATNPRPKDLIVQLWTDGVFGASQFILTELERQVRESDFAVLVLGPDDVVESRDEISDAPRDNVIFELGLFMGALSHERTFMVIPRDCEIKIPTDLLGLIPLKYQSGDSNNFAVLLATVCDQLRHTINKAGVK